VKYIVPLTILGTTAVVTGIVLYSRKKAGLPQLSNATLSQKVLSTIAATADPAKLRALANGAAAQGGIAEAAIANAKATTIEASPITITSNAAIAKAAQTAQTVASALPKIIPPTVRQGSTGAPVLQWQGVLAASGFAVTIDGNFGPETAGFTKQWQAQRGLTADGVVGPNTWKQALA
jgi:murein L,D-transpeptidase YcbB/YkuD